MTQEVTSTTSLGQRVGQSLGGVAVGALLMLAMVLVLFWNEGRAVKTALSLEEGAGAVRSVASSSIDARNEGALVHVAGPLRTDAPLADPLLGVQLQAVRLERSVEMFQWVESQSTHKETAVGGTETQRTRYEYTQAWRSSPQDAAQFQVPAGHHNPPMPLQRASFTVDSATLGAWRLNAQVLQSLAHWQPWDGRGVQLSQVEAAVHRALGTKPKVQIVDGALYIGANPAQPQLGDMRIRLRYVPLDAVSIVARQVRGELQPYRTHAGRQLLLTSAGVLPAEAMFEAAQSSNEGLTWVLRAAGLLLLMAGLNMVLRPLAVVASVLPWLGTLVALGTGTLAAVVGLVLGGAIISISWLVYRPWLSLVILLLCGLAAAAVIWWKHRKSPAAIEPDAALYEV